MLKQFIYKDNPSGLAMSNICKFNVFVDDATAAADDDDDATIISIMTIYFVECVSKIRHFLSVIHYTIPGAVCFQFIHFLVMIERIYILCLIIIIKSEVWTITHCLGLGHDTMVCAFLSFCILMIIFDLIYQNFE